MDFGVVQTWLAGIRAWPWAEAKSIAELGLYYLTVLAVIGCLLRLGAIGRMFKDFRDMRGPLWDLQNTVDKLKELEPEIKALGQQVAILGEKVEIARAQVAELQVESISNRLDREEAEEMDDTRTPEDAVAAEDPEIRNWQLLREYWQRNRRRIEFVIETIPDGRTKLAFDRLPRTNYNRIINKLQGQDRITAAAANASRKLNELFNAHRPRNRAIPDEVVGPLRVLDEQLDREIVSIDRIRAAEEEEGTGRRPPTGPANARGRHRGDPGGQDQPQPNGHLPA
jgi:hypothetical protein